MADFGPAFKKLMITEGGYSNRPQDRGGETYAGISRKHWPDWAGWTHVDAWKIRGGHPRDLDADELLQHKVRAFYLNNFWDAICGEEIDHQRIAEELFDSGINCGMKTAVNWLQRSLHMVAAAQLRVDGALGPKTLAAINGCRWPGEVLKAMNGLQFLHYWNLVMKDPTQSIFLRGWLRRVWE